MKQFSFFNSYYEAIQTVEDDADRLALYDAICGYMFDDVDPELTGMLAGMFSLIKPYLDTSKSRGEAGAKNQAETKTETNEIKTTSKKIKRETIEKEIEEEKEIEKELNTHVIPPGEIAEAYNATCTSLPKVEKLTDSRKRAIKALLKKYKADEIRAVFKRAERSDFLTGRRGGWGGASFDWLLKEANFVKVSEGNYDNKHVKGGGPGKFDFDDQRHYNMQKLERELLARGGAG